MVSIWNDYSIQKFSITKQTNNANGIFIKIFITYYLRTIN